MKSRQRLLIILAKFMLVFASCFREIASKSLAFRSFSNGKEEPQVRTQQLAGCDEPNPARLRRVGHTIKDASDWNPDLVDA